MNGVGLFTLAFAFVLITMVVHTLYTTVVPWTAVALYPPPRAAFSSVLPFLTVVTATASPSGSESTPLMASAAASSGNTVRISDRRMRRDRMGWPAGAVVVDVAAFYGDVFQDGDADGGDEGNNDSPPPAPFGTAEDSPRAWFRECLAAVLDDALHLVLAWISFSILFNLACAAGMDPGHSLSPPFPADDDSGAKAAHPQQWVPPCLTPDANDFLLREMREHGAESVYERFPNVPSSLRYCSACRFWRPPRSHHCVLCNRCVLKMDHHCPWIHNCVGYHNQRHFVGFLIHLLAGTTFSVLAFSFLYWAHTSGQGASMREYEELRYGRRDRDSTTASTTPGGEGEDVIMTFVFALVGTIWLAMLAFVTWNWRMLRYNLTSMESSYARPVSFRWHPRTGVPRVRVVLVGDPRDRNPDVAEVSASSDEDDPYPDDQQMLDWTRNDEFVPLRVTAAVADPASTPPRGAAMPSQSSEGAVVVTVYSPYDLGRKRNLAEVFGHAEVVRWPDAPLLPTKWCYLAASCVVRVARCFFPHIALFRASAHHRRCSDPSVGDDDHIAVSCGSTSSSHVGSTAASPLNRKQRFARPVKVMQRVARLCWLLAPSLGPLPGNGFSFPIRDVPPQTNTHDGDSV